MGKRKANKSLKAWVAFVKSVQKKYKLNYKDAISKAKVLKDDGADWMSNSFKQSKKMKGGEGDEMEEEVDVEEEVGGGEEGEEEVEEGEELEGGRRRRSRRTRKRNSKSRSRSRSRGRFRTFKRTMSRRKSASRKASRSMGLTMGVA